MKIKDNRYFKKNKIIFDYGYFYLYEYCMIVSEVNYMNKVKNINYLFVPPDILANTKGGLATCFFVRNNRFNGIVTPFFIHDYSYLIISDDKFKNIPQDIKMGNSYIKNGPVLSLTSSFCKFVPLSREMEKLFLKHKLSHT